MRDGTAISEELVIRFFAALEAGDIDTLREIYAPDAVIWHNDDLIEQPVEDNLKVLRGLHRVVSGLRYDIVRRVPAPDRRPRVLAAMIGALVFLANRDLRAGDDLSLEAMTAAFDAYADAVIPALAGHWTATP